MTDPRGSRPIGLPAEITTALLSLWTHYAGARPARVRTEIRGNVVTCVLVDAVGDFNRSMIAPDAHNPIRRERLTPAGYKSEAIAAIARLTRQRVTSLLSSHDVDTDVATEVFTLEPSLGRGAPALAERRLAHGTRGRLR